MKSIKSRRIYIWAIWGNRMNADERFRLSLYSSWQLRWRQCYQSHSSDRIPVCEWCLSTALHSFQLSHVHSRFSTYFLELVIVWIFQICPWKHWSFPTDYSSQEFPQFLMIAFYGRFIREQKCRQFARHILFICGFQSRTTWSERTNLVHGE